MGNLPSRFVDTNNPFSNVSYGLDTSFLAVCKALHFRNKEKSCKGHIRNKGNSKPYHNF